MIDTQLIVGMSSVCTSSARAFVCGRPCDTGVFLVQFRASDQALSRIRPVGAALPALLEILALNGRMATGAMHTQHEASALIVEKGGDCVLPAEGNRKSLHEDVRDWFADPEAQRKCFLSGMLAAATGASRRASRRSRTMSTGCRICGANGGSRHGWPGLKAVGRIKAVRERKGKQERSVRCHIMSAEISPERLL